MIRRAPSGAIVLRETDLQVGAFETILVYGPQLGSLDEYYQTISSPTSVIQTQLVRNGGDNLVAMNQLPELPRRQIVASQATGLAAARSGAKMGARRSHALIMDGAQGRKESTL